VGLFKKAQQVSRGAIKAAAKPHARRAHRPHPQAIQAADGGLVDGTTLPPNFQVGGILRMRRVWSRGRQISLIGEAGQ
jgi:hypothetical protein